MKYFILSTLLICSSLFATQGVHFSNLTVTLDSVTRNITPDPVFLYDVCTTTVYVTLQWDDNSMYYPSRFNYRIQRDTKPFTLSSPFARPLGFRTEQTHYSYINQFKVGGWDSSFTIYYRLTCTDSWVSSTYDTSATLSVNIDTMNIIAVEQIQIMSQPSFNVCPNPCSNILSITPINQSTTISIYNIHGQLMNRFNNLKSITTYNMSNYPNGIYLIKSQTNSNTYTKQILLQK